MLSELRVTKLQNCQLLVSDAKRCDKSGIRPHASGRLRFGCQGISKEPEHSALDHSAILPGDILVPSCVTNLSPRACQAGQAHRASSTEGGYERIRRHGGRQRRAHQWVDGTLWTTRQHCAVHADVGAHRARQRGWRPQTDRVRQ